MDIKLNVHTKNVLTEDKIEYGLHVIIDTTVLTDNRYKIPNIILYHSLGLIAQTVIVNNRIYALAGVVREARALYQLCKIWSVLT